jgi:N-acetylmuramoyl-L-alanine amidase
MLEVATRRLRGALCGLVALTALAVGSLSAVAQEPAPVLPEVVAARVSTTPERARLIVDLTGTTQFAIATVTGPDRIAVDVRASALPATIEPAVAGEGIVSSYTVNLAEPGRVRIELGLHTAAMVQQAYFLDPVEDQPARLVVDLVTTTPQDFAARAAADLANSIGREVPGAIASSEPSAEPSGEPSSEPPAPAESSAPASPSEPPPAAPAPATVDTGSRPLVVIDPGHGGHDVGASAPSGINEKDLTLAFALQLRDLLMATGKFDVALTRDDDTFLSLNERVHLARQNRADLLISLHADTFQQADIRGASIYTRDERAADILDKVLAEGETRADVVAGYLPENARPAVADILVDLMRRQARQRAYVAANNIVSAMEPSVTLRRFPVRQADFFVLQAPEIPSLLIELGFMSNPADIKNLESEQWRNTVVASIANGIEAYFAALATR